VSLETRTAAEETRRQANKKFDSLDLSEIRNALLQSGVRLEDKVHSRVGWFISAALEQLSQHKVRIAFIGQVKAGKSSLMNALMKRPDFLPADGGSSTGVTTRVHFGSPERPADKPLFHFLTEHEWEGLLGERKTQDADEPALQSLPSRGDLESLWRRARERLGPDHERLLKKHHLFNPVVRQIEEDCAVAVERPHAMHQKLLSGATRISEAFLDGNPIAYPSVLIDTPGVNDLFFVQEEMTLANLADADVYVLVLSAQNPLSRADLSFLRLLKGLKREKIVVAINKIDALAEIAEHGAKFEERVQAVLKSELPEASIPVVMTSALWANAALKDSPFAMEGLIAARFVDYAGRCGVGNLVSSSRGSDPDDVLRRYAKALYSCSGLSELASAIEGLVSASIVEDQLLPVSSTLAAISHNSAMSGRYGLQTLLAGQRKPVDDALAESRERLQAFWGKAGLLIQRMEKEWKALAESEVADVERYLLFAVEKFAEAQAFLLFEDAKRRAAFQNWSENTLAFRAELADLIGARYNEIRQKLHDRQREGEAALRQAIEGFLPTMENVMQFGMRPGQGSPAYLMPLSKATVFELDDFWQHEISRSQDCFEKKCRDLKAVVLSEFNPIVKEMTDAATRGLELTIDEMIRHLDIFVTSSLSPIVQQLDRLKIAEFSGAITQDEFFCAADAGNAVGLFENEGRRLAFLRREAAMA
jgi:GTP-binding protein EngB required for normal cell division